MENIWKKMHIAHDDRGMKEGGGGACFSLLTLSVCDFFGVIKKLDYN